MVKYLNIFNLDDVICILEVSIAKFLEWEIFVLYNFNIGVEKSPFMTRVYILES